MIAVVLDVLIAAALVTGSFFVVTGTLGLLRLPDFFSRIHAAGMTDTLGVGLILLGLSVEAGWSSPSVRLMLVLLMLWFTTPVANHALAKAAIQDGVPPMTSDRSGEAAGAGEEEPPSHS